MDRSSGTKEAILGVQITLDPRVMTELVIEARLEGSVNNAWSVPGLD